MGNAGRGIFGVMRDEQKLSFAFTDQDIHKPADQLAVERIQSLQGFIEDQQCRMFHQRTNNQRQPLLSPGKTMKWRIRGTFIDAKNIQPLLYQLVLPVGDGLINAD
jgi:hypothetical protein